MLKLYRLCIEVARERQLQMRAGHIDQNHQIVMMSDGKNKILGKLTNLEREISVNGVVVAYERLR